MYNEIKDIPDYEGLYGVTADGRVWNYIANKWQKKHWMKQSRGSYNQIQLIKDGIVKMKYVHRLVALAWIPNPNNLPFVCHKLETIPSTDTVENLWWGTGKMNSQDCIRKGRTHKGHGKMKERELKKILTKENKRSYRESVIDKFSKFKGRFRDKEVKKLIQEEPDYFGIQVDLAKIFNISKESIRQIRKAKST